MRFFGNWVMVSFVAVATAVGLAGGVVSFAQAGALVGSPDALARIVRPIDENQLVRLSGNTHPLAKPEFDQGAVPDGLMFNHLLLQLKRSPQQERALEQLINELHDPTSPNFHQWLTAQQFGKEFGPAQQDVQTVTAWLSSHGFEINSVYPSGMLIDISGTAADVRDAFHTEIHNYLVQGQEHMANASDPAIPAALAPVVAGFASLHDFRPHPMIRRHPAFSYPYQGQEQYDVGPQDFATIYNVNPLWTANKPIRGAGETIAVLEDTDMLPADWSTFRSAFGLASYSGTLTQIHPQSGAGTIICTDPGRNLDEGEAALDAEWSGGVAPDAAIELASCTDTTFTSGDLIAAQNLVNSSTPPPILSDSYGGCEAEDGSSGNAFINGIWQQAVSEGVSVFVAAGDEGAAECDYGRSFATHGISVDGTASPVYDVAVGGTDFHDFVAGTLNVYWTTKNGAGGESALSYVPEMTWNDSCASSVLFIYEGYSSGNEFCNTPTGEGFLFVTAGSGGPSSIYSKPSWQSGVFGIVNDGKRDIPDVSLFAADGLYTHDLMYCMSDPNEQGAPCDYAKPPDSWINSAGGTSFSAPAFAGIQALINQKTGSRQGNPNVMLYALAAAEYGSSSHPNPKNLAECNASRGNSVAGTCVFYDVTTGDIDLPCKGKKQCYTSPASNIFGVLSTSDQTLHVAYPAGSGWDFGTGLGTVNVNNLVNAWSGAQ